ncbi:MAG: T9SS type A sorting domain-containing protein [Candidatus Delongbacteria bacterium]
MSRFPQGLLLLLFWVGAAQGLIRVPQDVDSIQTAIDLAMDGDTVVVAPGTWYERLHINSGQVTLCSNFLFSQDSADIVATILDGQFQGTILSVDMDAESRLELNGFTVTRGQGAYDAETGDRVGGGVDFIQAGTVYLSNLVFHNNRAPRAGSAVFYIDFQHPSSARFVLNNVNCFENEYTNSYNAAYGAIHISYAKRIEASRLRISNINQSMYKQYLLVASDTLEVDDCSFSGLTNMLGMPYKFGAYDNYGRSMYMQLTNINISENVFNNVGGFAFVQGYNGFCRLHNIRMENNVFPNGGMQFEFGNYGTYLADSIFICGNQSAKSYALFNCQIPGTITNLFVIGNHMGSHAEFEPTWPGENAIMEDLSIDGAIFADNVLERSLAPPGQYTSGGHLLHLSGHTADSLFYRNMSFINNLHIDPDVYEMADVYAGIPGANDGRLIDGIYGVRPHYFEMDSCVFIGNRQPNIIPEVEPVNSPGAQFYIGSNVWIYGGTDIFTRIVKNVQMIDCDDGGIVIGNKGDLFVDNVMIINNKRAGLAIGCNDTNYTANVNNVYISNLQQQESYTEFPYYSCHQNALSLVIRSNQANDISNITIEGCDVPFIIRNEESYEGTIIRNSLFSENGSIDFENPNGQPITFEYCLLPEDRPGVGNLVEVDPLFDEMLGPPWLSVLSPCIDAGIPDPMWDDREDPTNPGHALWPSQGTLRNDIGYTGGPHATLYDTTWTHLPKWEPRTIPQVFSLGAPWPNPFNPVTWIPITLQSPAAFTLAVYNLLGQQVGLLHHGPLHAGTHVFPLEAQSLASGTYVVTMTCAGRVQSRAITLLR